MPSYKRIYFCRNIVYNFLEILYFFKPTKSGNKKKRQSLTSLAFYVV